MWWPNIKPSTSIWVQTHKTCFFLNFVKISWFLFCFSVFWAKNIEKHILTSIWSSQHPQNIQYLPLGYMTSLMRVHHNSPFFISKRRVFENCSPSKAPASMKNPFRFSPNKTSKNWTWPCSPKNLLKVKSNYVFGSI